MSSGITGSGAGIGTPPLTPFELDTQAAALISRTSLGITQDSLNQPLNEMDRPRIWKYTAEPGNPFIMPLNRLRVLMKADNAVAEVWIRAFQKLSEMLSAETREALLREIRLPPELRDPAFGSLDKILGFMATAIAWIDTNAEVSSEQRVARADDINYTEMSSTAIIAAAQNSLEVIAGAREFLNEAGHADRNFDRLMGLVDHLDQYAADLRE